MEKGARIAVVGATGLVGRRVLAALAEADHPEANVTALASERSVGLEVEYGHTTLEVEAASAVSLRAHQLVVLAAPSEVSRTLAPEAQKGRAWVVDTSRAFLSDLSVPLVAAGLPGDGLENLCARPTAGWERRSPRCSAHPRPGRAG